MDGLASLLMALMALVRCGLLACRAEAAGDRIASRYGEPRSVGVLIEWQLQWQERPVDAPTQILRPSRP